MSVFSRNKTSLVQLRNFHIERKELNLYALTKGMNTAGTSEETKARRRELQAKREYEQATRETWE